MNRNTRLRRGTAGIFAIALCLASEAGASPLFELVGATNGTGGFNARVTGAGAASAYFNPALLSRSGQQFELGVLVLSDHIGMTLDGRTSGDVPLSVGNRTFIDANGDPISNQTAPTDWLQHGCNNKVCSPPFAPRPRQGAGSSGKTQSYAQIGLVSHLIKDRLVVGLYSLVPLAEFNSAHSFYNDEREQIFSNSLHPEFYSDRLTAISLAFGVGSRITSRLSLGASFTLDILAQAQSNSYVRDASDYNKLLMSNDIEVHPHVSPHFGIVYDALDWLHLAATAHSPGDFRVVANIRATLPDGKESIARKEEVYDYMPWMFALGGTADVVRDKSRVFSVAANVKYALWSNYVDRHGEDPGRQGKQFDFKDVPSETVGVRYSTGALGTYLDLQYQPTPIPPQTGRTNYVDNDRVSGIVGAEYVVWLADEVPLKFGLQTQVHRLLRRYQKKNDALITDELPDGAIDSATRQPVAGAAGLQTNNPGWPGFASEGWILGGALTATLMY